MIPMSRFVSCVAALLAALTPFESVYAIPTTWTFTGVVDWDYNQGPTGQTISGWLRLDPTTLTIQETNGTTSSSISGAFCPPSVPVEGDCTGTQSDPLQVSGEYVDGIHGFSVGGDLDTYDVGSMRMHRNGNAGHNSFEARGMAAGPFALIVINVSDALGTSSSIFADPNGGLNLTQEINWFASGAIPRFEVLVGHGEDPSLYKSGTILTMAVSTVPEPSSFALALAGLGLLGFARLAQRRLAA
jgi:hypothetical protein